MDDDVFTRFWINLMSRPSGPLSFRFVLQPLMGIVLAILAGIRDAKAEKSAYLWAVFTSLEHRIELLKSGWKDVAKLFILAIILDVAFQLMVFRWVYPLESIVVAFVLACIPYAVVRGPVNRIYKWVNHSGRSHSNQ